MLVSHAKMSQQYSDKSKGCNCIFVNFLAHWLLYQRAHVIINWLMCVSVAIVIVCGQPS